VECGIGIGRHPIVMPAVPFIQCAGCAPLRARTVRRLIGMHMRPTAWQVLLDALGEAGLPAQAAPRMF